jgi:agmatinase
MEVPTDPDGSPAQSSLDRRDLHATRRSRASTFLKAPYCEDIRTVGDYEVAVVGAPFDMGTTYRSGARFGPQAVRRISALYDGYSLDLGVDLLEELRLCDAGDVFVIRSNIEKTFDQIDRAVHHLFESGCFPVVIGGDHSISYPNIRGIAPLIDGNLGIIHCDRHIDIQERDMDERMHTTHFFHATNIPNVRPANLVQIAIGVWYGSRPGLKVARERETVVITVGDIEAMGIERATEIALEVAWSGTKAVFLSFDIDCLDGGFTPGTGSPEPGGLLPREALKAVRMIARARDLTPDRAERHHTAPGGMGHPRRPVPAHPGNLMVSARFRGRGLPAQVAWAYGALCGRGRPRMLIWRV